MIISVNKYACKLKKVRKIDSKTRCLTQKLTSSVEARLSLGVSSEFDAIHVAEFSDFVHFPFSFFSDKCLVTISWKR